MARALGKDRRHGRRENTRRRENHEVRPEPVIGLLQQSFQRFSGSLALLGPMLHAIAIDGEHRDFGARGEGDDREEKQQREQQRGSRGVVQGGLLDLGRAGQIRSW